MKGKHHIVLESKRLKYEFDIKRNITVILGDSATGKTTMLGMLSDYARFEESRGVKLESDVPCIVFVGIGDNWKIGLVETEDSIVFIDEDHSFVFSEDFAHYVADSSNYFVIITRRPLYNLPYSIDEVYGIRTTGRFHFPEKIYHEFYQYYDIRSNEDMKRNPYTFLLEDSGSGYEFYRNTFEACLCKSSEGNSKLAKLLSETEGSSVVIADGAAFGAYIEKILSIAESKTNVILYLPESFEWLVLKSGIVGHKDLDDILACPEVYIESKEYMSWERFFTALLIHCTENDPIKQYSKVKLLPFYYTGKNRDAILDIMPEEIRKLASQD